MEQKVKEAKLGEKRSTLQNQELESELVRSFENVGDLKLQLKKSSKTLKQVRCNSFPVSLVWPASLLVTLFNYGFCKTLNFTLLSHLLSDYDISQDCSQPYHVPAKAIYSASKRRHQ